MDVKTLEMCVNLLVNIESWCFQAAMCCAVTAGSTFYMVISELRKSAKSQK